jgi:hypothetical protein
MTTTNTKRISATAKTLGQYAINKQRIERILHWSALEYAEYQWEAMEAYIICSGEGDMWGLELQGRSAEYRKWWVNQWNIRDVANVDLIDGCSTIADARAMYKHLHDAHYLSTDYIESEALLHSEAYAVGRAIDEYHSKNRSNQCKTR